MPVLNHRDIQDIIPHRYPLLMVDAVMSLEPDVAIVARKCVTGNEPCYAGMSAQGVASDLAYPFSLMIESFGQAGAILLLYSARLVGRKIEGLPIFIAGKDCFFDREAFPGDTLEHRVRLERVIADTMFLSGEIWVEEQRIARLDWLTAVMRPPQTLGR